MQLVILDVTVGLILVYLVLSLVCSALVEWLAVRKRKRAEVLERGLEALLGRYAQTFLQHRLIRNLGQGDQNPSYIASETFAEVVLDLVLNVYFEDKAELLPLSDRARVARYKRDMVELAAKNPDSREARQQADLATTLLSFWDQTEGHREKLSARIQQWFDDSMERVSGWYRSWAQTWTLMFATVVVLAVNADTLHIVRVLMNSPAAREALVVQAQARAESEGVIDPGLETIKSELIELEPVLGWSGAEFTGTKLGGRSLILLIFGKLAGLGITILALRMGGPFWFNALNKLLRLRARISSEEEQKQPDGEEGTAPATAGATEPPLPPDFKSTFDPDTVRHTPYNAYWLGKAAELAYQDDAGFRSATAKWGLEHSPVAPRAGTQVHVAGNTSAAIVAFRGTEPDEFDDILADVKFKLIEGFGGVGLMHRGFKEALDPIWEDLVAAITKRTRTGQTLWFTGHSLGGALAVLAARRWIAEERSPRPHGVYTIGQPRVGNGDFAACLEKDLPGQFFRYVNNRDIVPRMPLRKMTYQDAGTVLYFDSKGRLHEDPSLWMRLLDAVVVTPENVKLRMKETVGDHSATEYSELLRRVAQTT